MVLKSLEELKVLLGYNSDANIPVTDDGYRLPEWQVNLYGKLLQIEQKLNAAKVSYQWNGNEFCIARINNISGYAMWRYVGYDAEYDDFFFGNETEELVYGKELDQIVLAATKWQSAKFVRK